MYKILLTRYYWTSWVPRFSFCSASSPFQARPYHRLSVLAAARLLAVDWPLEALQSFLDELLADFVGFAGHISDVSLTKNHKLFVFCDHLAS